MSVENEDLNPCVECGALVPERIAEVKTGRGRCSLCGTISVQLSGEDGNVFNVIGRVSRALKAAGEHAAAKEFTDKAFAAKSYDEVLQLCMRTVNVT
jgi:hydroxyethylthiazole kinase-like sugar kinase family protein